MIPNNKALGKTTNEIKITPNLALVGQTHLFFRKKKLELALYNSDLNK